MAWSEAIESEDATDALRYVVGYAGCSEKWICHPQWKGYLPDFRFRGIDTDKQFVSFVPSKNWLHFYFRKPVVNSSHLAWEAVASVFPDIEEKAGEWRVRVHNLEDAKSVTTLIEEFMKYA